jgi:hypothetical protein
MFRAQQAVLDSIIAVDTVSIVSRPNYGFLFVFFLRYG